MSCPSCAALLDAIQIMAQAHMRHPCAECGSTGEHPPTCGIGRSLGNLHSTLMLVCDRARARPASSGDA